jgi:hypothetical protein
MTAPQSTKHGQVQINETMLVLFAIVLIIIVGIFVYYRFSLQRIEIIKDELTEQEASVLLSSISNSPEIQCTQSNCIDTSKLIPFTQLSKEQAAYYALGLGKKRITINQVYPVVEADAHCDISRYNQYEYPSNCNHWIIYDYNPSQSTNMIKISTPISLYYPALDIMGIGRLEIGIYP